MTYAIKSVVIKPDIQPDHDTRPEEDLFQNADYIAEDTARLDAWKRDEWYFTGVLAVAKIEFMLTAHPLGSAGFEKISSGGLWGIESDSVDEYFAEVYAEEVEDLKARLAALGIGEDKITVKPWRK